MEIKVLTGRSKVPDILLGKSGSSSDSALLGVPGSGFRSDTYWESLDPKVLLHSMSKTPGLTWNVCVCGERLAHASSKTQSFYSRPRLKVGRSTQLTWGLACDVDICNSSKQWRNTFNPMSGEMVKICVRWDWTSILTIMKDLRMGPEYALLPLPSIGSAKAPPLGVRPKI